MTDPAARADIIIDGHHYQPIAYGQETAPDGELYFTRPCHVCGTPAGSLHTPACTLGAGHPYRRPPFCRDCHAPIGAVHRLGCGIEQCPHCLGQYASCACTSNEDDPG